MTAYQNDYIKKDLCFQGTIAYLNLGFKKDVLGEKKEIKVYLTTDKYSDMVLLIVLT
jgi:L-lysine 2,3-aminomutase